MNARSRGNTCCCWICPSPWILQDRSGLLPFSWNDSHQARIGLISRADASADIQWFEVDPTYIFHTFNAHEDNAGRVVFEAAYGRIFDQDWLGPFNEAPPLLKRYTLDIQAARPLSNSWMTVPSSSQDSPCPLREVIPIRLCAGILKPADFQEIKKYDFEQGTSQTLVFDDGKMAAEPVFVPREGDQRG